MSAYGGSGHGTWPGGPQGQYQGPQQPGPHRGQHPGQHPGPHPAPHPVPRQAPPPGWGQQPPYPYGRPPLPGPPLPPPPPTRGQRFWRCVRNPLHAAQRVFRPSRPDRVEDRTVGRLQLWRTILGLAIWLWMSIGYGMLDGAEEAEKTLTERGNQSWHSALVLICTFTVVFGAFAAKAHGQLRRLYLRRALRPLGAIVALVASMATFPLAVAPDAEGFRDLVGLPGKIVIGLACLWSLGFALYGVGLSLVHVFRTADIHEFMPPVLATLLVWEMALLDVVNGAYADVPGPVRTLFILGAPLTVTTLSCWEAYRLRRHHGLSLRAALRP
ncbi:hypothetical protein [Streptomyces luteolus]|uniref:Integral membrane protein n=1 Tax=Streptomyces luteolus TaxID=3043615 RepID=A0ABT6SQ47_9ACTN|nr:hypothetical protein [Streptomyces sp. B-S-A12]MDI3417722.1 hypothetical protein [Streptomyces sp. B-S-A12]